MATARDVQILGAEARNARAGAWMKTGIALMGENTRASLERAERLFTEAIWLRERLPLEERPHYRYCLAASWLNRAAALERLGLGRYFAEVMRSYDAALGHLALLPRAGNPLFTRRLAIAWLNRGQAMIGRSVAGAEALECIDRGIAVLAEAAAEGIEDRERLMGCSQFHRARALLDSEHPDAAAARTAARGAIERLRKEESANEEAAEAGVKARQTLCRAIGFLASDLGEGSEEHEALVEEATEAAREGIDVASQWEARGKVSFRFLAMDLFRFAGRACQLYRPHLLGEFVRDVLQRRELLGCDEAEMRREAILALQKSFAALCAGGFGQAESPEFCSQLERLCAVETWLLAEARGV